MRRDLVVQVIVDYGDFWENFATAYEAESFINANIDELDLPLSVWLEDMRGNKKMGLRRCGRRLRHISPR